VNREAEARWHRSSQIATIGLFLIAVIWCAYVAQHVLVPLLLAWAVATIVLPLVKGLERLGIPKSLSAIPITLLLFSIILVLLFLLSAPVTYWLGRATYIGALLREKMESFSQPLAFLQELQKSLNTLGSGSATPTLKVEAESSSLVTNILSVLTPTISGTVIFFVALIFYLIYRDNLRHALVFLVQNRESRLAIIRALNDIDDNMTRYFGTFTVVNLGLGAVAACLTWATGLPNPLLWAVLACVLNYVPYIGPAVVTGTLALVGLVVHPTLGEAAVAPLVYLAIVTLEGQFLTPALMGKNLELNPFAVFVAIAFCAWLWGPLGAFLAVPILMACSVVYHRATYDERPSLPGD